MLCRDSFRGLKKKINKNNAGLNDFIMYCKFKGRECYSHGTTTKRSDGVTKMPYFEGTTEMNKIGTNLRLASNSALPSCGMSSDSRRHACILLARLSFADI